MASVSWIYQSESEIMASVSSIDSFHFRRMLREMFKIEEADYLMSICGNDGLRELSSPGKSGSVFYLSHDERFLIKTLRKQEMKVQLTGFRN